MKALTTTLMYALSLSAFAGEIDFSSDKTASKLPKVQIVKYNCNSFKTECSGLDEKGKVKLKITSAEYSNEAIVLDDHGKKIATIDDSSQIISLFMQLEKVGHGQCSLELYVSNPEVKKSLLNCAHPSVSSVDTDVNRAPGFSESFIRLRPKSE